MGSFFHRYAEYLYTLDGLAQLLKRTCTMTLHLNYIIISVGWHLLSLERLCHVCFFKLSVRSLPCLIVPAAYRRLFFLVIVFVV